MSSNKYLSEQEAKELIKEIGRRMFAKGFVAANDGNISCKIDDNIILTTCTGVSKGYLTDEMIVKMDLDGNILEGVRKPSSEVKMHIRVYKENPEALAVTHAHPPVSTAFAVAGIALDTPILPEGVVQLGAVPVAKYATPGTQQVPDSIAPFCKDYNAVLLANHGALTWGKNLIEAYYRMESVEYYATLLMITGKFLGKQNVLSNDQIKDLVDIRTSLGTKKGGIPVGVDVPTNDKDVLPNVK